MCQVARCLTPRVLPPARRLEPGETWLGEMELTAHPRYWDLPPWEASDPSAIPLPAVREGVNLKRFGASGVYAEHS